MQPTLVQSLLRTLKGSESDMFVIIYGYFNLKQKNLICSQQFNQLSYALKAGFILYELIHTTNYLQFLVSYQTNYLDMHQNLHYGLKEKLGGVTAQLKHTRGLEMLIQVLIEYIYAYWHEFDAHIAEIYHNYVELYNGAREFDYTLIDNADDPFLASLVAELYLCRFQHFKTVYVIGDFIDIYLKQLSEAVSEEVIKNSTYYPHILNLSQRFRQRLLPADYRQFYQHFHGKLLNKYYEIMVFAFLNNGFVSDPCSEFFIYSKLSILNVQQQLPNNPFEAYNQVYNYNETILVKNLFPYFITEKTAREMVVCGRMVLLLKEHDTEITFTKDVESSLFMDLSSTSCNYITKEFDFHSAFIKFNDRIYDTYIRSLDKSTIYREINVMLQVATMETISMQLDTLFDEYFLRLSQFKNYSRTEYIKVVERAAVQPLAELLKQHQLKLNGVNVRRAENEDSELCRLLQQLNQDFDSMGLPNVLQFQNNTERAGYQVQGLAFNDLESEFYYVERMENVFNVHYRSHGGSILNHIVLSLWPYNELILQPPVRAGFSKVFRQLFVLVSIRHDFYLAVGRHRTLFRELGRFETYAAKKGYFMQTGAQASVRLGRGLTNARYRIEQVLLIVQNYVQVALWQAVGSFTKNFNINDYHTIKRTLARLIANLFDAVLLNRIQFYSLVENVYAVTNQYIYVVDTQASIITGWLSRDIGYGMVENAEYRGLAALLREMGKRLYEVEDYIANIMLR